MTSRHEAVLTSVIAELRQLSHVRAILAYGSTATRKWRDGSDIDLIAITAEPAPAESLHLFIDGVPLDLSIRNRAAWQAGETGWTPPDGLSALWDPENLVSAATPRRNDPRRAVHFRYAHRHMLLKVERYQHEDPLIAEALAANAVHWVIVSYFHARGMRFPGIDKAIPWFREHDATLLQDLMEAVRMPEKRFTGLTAACELALAPIGGLWRDDEVFVSGWHGTASEEDASAALRLFAPVTHLVDVTETP